MDQSGGKAVARFLSALCVIALGAWGIIVAPVQPALAATEITFTAEELLGKPTDASITINIVPASTIEYHYQYGTVSGTYAGQTDTWTANGGEPHEAVIAGLDADTRYYYRMRYHLPGETDWVERTEYSFHTQRSQGSTFVFTIISDTHAEFADSDYRQAVQNVIADEPDFHIDLGDTFMLDNDTAQSQVNQEYLLARNPLYMGGIGHSAPIFLASGNHENEEGWNLDDTPFSIAVGSVKARKLYYPTPIDDSFYSANTDPLAALDVATYGDQYREDYYAWEWGDALFVVFDPFQYTMSNPYGASAGEGSDDPATGDRWNWSLGQEQYDWLKQTLEASDAKYKFMFAHHMLGGTQNYVRGGAVPAHMFEWGGYNSDGSTWGWDTKRSGWDTDPIRQLMIDNGVSAFFHGHDHQYAYEVRDGIVYQSLPKPSTGVDFNYYSESDPYTERVIGNAGHLRVTVSPEQTTVEYVRSNITGVSHSYTILPNSGTTYDLTMVVDPAGSGTTEPAAGVHSHPAGTVVPIMATAASGYRFGSWTGDVADPDAPATTVTMDGDKTVTAGFVAETSILGGVNGDGAADSTDALIVLSCDVGVDTAAYCPMNCGDANGDGLVNSTDALVILSYDVGMDVPFEVGEPGCPASVTPCSGCSP